MPFFRKKPVVIEAVKLTPENAVTLAIWCNGVNVPISRVCIPTLEGTMNANPGDYIIKGVRGEFYPCKPEIFEETYEQCEAP